MFILLFLESHIIHDFHAVFCIHFLFSQTCILAAVNVFKSGMYATGKYISSYAFHFRYCCVIFDVPGISQTLQFSSHLCYMYFSTVTIFAVCYFGEHLICISENFLRIGSRYRCISSLHYLVSQSKISCKLQYASLLLRWWSSSGRHADVVIPKRPAAIQMILFSHRHLHTTDARGLCAP